MVNSNGADGGKTRAARAARAAAGPAAASAGRSAAEEGNSGGGGGGGDSDGDGDGPTVFFTQRAFLEGMGRGGRAALGGGQGLSTCLGLLEGAGLLQRVKSSDDGRARITLLPPPPSPSPSPLPFPGASAKRTVRGMRALVYDEVSARIEYRAALHATNPASPPSPSPTAKTLEVTLGSLAASLGLQRPQVLAALKGLADRGLVAFRPPPPSENGVQILAAARAGVGASAGAGGNACCLRLPPPAAAAVGERRSRGVAKLGMMMAYAGGSRCRRAFLASYFGETGVACGTCDVCATGGGLPF